MELQLQHQSFQGIFRVDSFRIDWFYLLAVQGIFKCLLQDHSSKASILLPSAFVMVYLSHPHNTTEKTIALTIQIFIRLVKAMVFSVVMYGCEIWTVKTLESPLECKEIQPVHPKGDSPGCSLEELMLKLKLQYFGHLMRRAESFEKTLMLGGIGGGGEGGDRG